MSSASARRRPRKWPFPSWRRDERGATALEFALVSPVLILLLVGAFQVAWAVHCASTVRWTLEAASRALLLDPTTTQDQIKSAMVAKLNGLVDSSKLTVSLTTDASSGTQMFVVSSTYAAPLAIPFARAQTLNFKATTSVPDVS